MYRLLPDEILSPEIVTQSFWEKHLALILCVVAVVAVTAAVLIVILKRKKSK